MARAIEMTGSPTHRHSKDVVAVPRSPLYQAYQMLHWGFTALPVIAGLDKFANLMTRWDDYLAPQVSSFIQSNTPITPHQFMLGVGAVEVLAGLLVAIRPRIGGVVVGLWLMGIVANLLLGMHYFDVALRDFGLMVGAFALAKLGAHFDHAHKQRADEDVTHEELGLARPREGHARFWRHRDDDMV